MEIRHPRLEETVQLKEIWKVCFGDDDEYIQFYFSNAYQIRNTLVCAENDVIAAMMTVLPCILSVRGKQHRGSYVYAVATRPEYRKQGLMTRMHDQAKKLCEQRGDHFLTLVPASEELFSMYQKCGYQIFTSLVHDQIMTWDWKEKGKKTVLQDICNADFLNMRKAYLETLPASIRLDNTLENYSAEELKMAGCHILSVQNEEGQGYLVYYYESDRTVKIREIGLTQKCFEAAIHTIAERLNADQLILAMSRLTYFNVRQAKPYSMVFWLDETLASLPGETVYMNLMLD